MTGKTTAANREALVRRAAEQRIPVAELLHNLIVQYLHEK